MRMGILALTVAILALDASAGVAPLDAPSPPAAVPVAEDVWLIPGGFPPRREPDGNTVVFAAPEGLIVMDTGRHPWHVQAIEAFARRRGQPVAAVVNSHWHLDHTTGNAELRKAFPDVHVYASRAMEGALKDFMPKSAADTRAYLASGAADPATAEDLKGDLAAIDNAPALLPDRPIGASAETRIAGRLLKVNLAENAATAGDVWLYDPKTRIAAVGDLVTLPAPFLDTACPAGWTAALAEVEATPFTILIPGHGPVMTRAQFGAWKGAFQAMIDCSASGREKSQCASDWASAVQSLLEPGELAQKRARLMTADYVDMLRAGGGKSAFCEA
jgi:glyoxylase-like metal-dependent hydrolase (beta-lactamase superfamily II)